MAKKYDPRLVHEANRSFSFIFESFEAFKRSPGLSINAVMDPHVQNGRCNLINPGLVLAACYIYFIYPREAAVGAVTVNEEGLKLFHVSEHAAPSQVLRRLRNSLSHGDFCIDDAGHFTFRDRESFEIRVHFADLGTFVDAFGRRMVSRGEMNGGGELLP